jgi:hypothetical protein
MCQKVLRFVDDHGEALVLGSRFELLHV